MTSINARTSVPMCKVRGARVSSLSRRQSCDIAPCQSDQGIGALRHGRRRQHPAKRCGGSTSLRDRPTMQANSQLSQR
jgi:hypothetical protein